MAPKYVQFVAELPKTNTGKIKKTGLGLSCFANWSDQIPGVSSNGRRQEQGPEIHSDNFIMGTSGAAVRRIPTPSWPEQSSIRPAFWSS